MFLRINLHIKQKAFQLNESHEPQLEDKAILQSGALGKDIRVCHFFTL